MSNNPIPIFRPSYGKRELNAIKETFDSGWIGLGPKTAEFEKKFADFIGVKYAIGLNSGTAALDLALKAHEIKGGEVIVPALTFVSTALAPLYNDCEVVFADIDEKSLCIDWNDVVSKVTERTRAVIPVHYAGVSAGVKQFQDEADKKSIIIIEDCAHAVGNPSVGGVNTGAWSYHAVKNLATGDGGMITTNDNSIYQKLLPLRWCGIDKSTWERSEKKYGWDYSIKEIGYKSHMSDITATLGLVQLERINELNNARKMRALLYLHYLRDLEWITLPEFDDNSSWHMFIVRINGRDRFIDYMIAHGISIGVHYKPLNTYPIFPNTKLPVTDRVWKTLATLPLYPDMSNGDFHHIIETIRSFHDKC